MHNKPAPLSVHLPLLWREFYFVLASRHPNFDKMKDNSLCLQFPWEEDAEKLERFRQVRLDAVQSYVGVFCCVYAARQ